MSTQRSTFGKRQREQDKKDKAKAKEQRLAARRSENRIAKGPEIAWDEAHQTGTSDDTATTDTPPPAPDRGPRPPNG